ncbi:hypothetical protein IFT77_07560 [Frigoribacterium sp. CFBP 13729]|uniref:hypothetical protein n=1 Tax=Frigoribacterium sp. CFBP 13729 TaxID=2775293 RepID=UPI00177D873F|nr:hypothetical protein [Frigoribacterium sp. CFBP 13729]MBD8610339.1 hypothetical protein [Frigoribacterium sp. CFBP 13729]
MTQHLTRRQLLIGATALSALTVAAPSGAAAWGAPATTDADSDVRIDDLGPAVVQFPLMSSLVVGDTLYIGSRNLQPARVIGFDLATKAVTTRTELSSGYAVQALAASPDGASLYIGVLRTEANGASVHRWDLTTADTAAVPLAETGDRDVRALAVAPDGMIYVAGGGDPTDPPSLWEVDPTSGMVANWGLPDPGATIAQAVATTATTVYLGTGSVLAGGAGSTAKLYSFDRSTRSYRDILPNEFASAVSVTSLSVLDDLLGVTLKGPGKSILIEIASPHVYETIPQTGMTLRRRGSDIYYIKVPSVVAYSRTTKKITNLQTRNLDTLWGLDVVGDRLVGASAYGFVAEIDPATRTSMLTELIEAGAPAAPQTAMGIAVGGGAAYVGGTGALNRFDVTTGAQTLLRMPGEAKDGVVVDGILYTGQYNSQGMWRYDPTSGDAPAQVVAPARGQNRPLDVCWDAVNGLALLGAQNDTDGGGSVTTFAPTSGASTTTVNPVDARQLVRAVTTADGVAYLGGDNIYPDGPRSTVVAWDPVARKELWRVDPGLTAGIAALATDGRHLFGLGRRASGLFVLDLRTQVVVTTLDVRSVATDFGALARVDDTIYGVSDTTLFRVDARTLELSTVVAGIDGGWYSGPHLDVDENGVIYTMRGLNLVAVQDGARPQPVDIGSGTTDIR